MTTNRGSAPKPTATAFDGGAIQLPLLDLSEPAEDSTGEEPQPRVRVQRHSTPRQPGQVITCAWCGEPRTIAATGRLPKWCSDACRHRAWEQKRAAESGLVAVEVVERIIETVVERPAVLIESRPHAEPKNVEDFVTALQALTTQLDNGRIYDRDLATLDAPVTELLHALTRRNKNRRQRSLPRW